MLKSKVAIVTGSTSGIGLGIAKELARLGADLVLNGFGEASEIEAIRSSIEREHGVHAVYDGADMSRGDAVRGLIAATVETFGRLDILVNNAGILRWERMADTSFESWNEVVAVNQTGVFLGMRAVAPQMKEQHSGSIVNISSVGGLSGASACFTYAATKWAVRGITKGAAIELGPHNVKVNSIHPGIIDTPMMGGTDLDGLADTIGVPLQRYAQPEEVAKLALWLVSDDNSYSTGAEFVIDGGQTA